MQYPPQRWAIVAAWVAALASVVPACWRILMLLGVAPYGMRDMYIDSPATIGYVVTLDLLQVGAGLLTFGLVRPWGEVWPGWMPGVGGRRISPRLVLGIASTGATLVVLITFALVGVFGSRLLGLAAGPTPLDGTSGLGFWLWLAMYLPWLAWGPALVVAIVGHWRRRSPSTRTNEEGQRQLYPGDANPAL